MPIGLCGKKRVVFLELAVLLHMVSKVLGFPLDVAGADAWGSRAALGALDTGCPGRTTGYLEIWKL